MIPGHPQYQETAAEGEGEEYRLHSDARFYSIEADAGIVDWRAECFARMGFSKFQAHTMAIRRDIDREYVEGLLAKGAHHSHVLEILL